MAPIVTQPRSAFLRDLSWTPHEMARFQDRVRGVHRRLSDYLATERGRRVQAHAHRELVRSLVTYWSASWPPYR